MYTELILKWLVSISLGVIGMVLISIHSNYGVAIGVLVMVWGNNVWETYKKKES